MSLILHSSSVIPHPSSVILACIGIHWHLSLVVICCLSFVAIIHFLSFMCIPGHVLSSSSSSFTILVHSSPCTSSPSGEQKIDHLGWRPFLDLPLIPASACHPPSCTCIGLELVVPGSVKVIHQCIYTCIYLYIYASMHASINRSMHQCILASTHACAY
jgi:hypothetical protein